MLLQNSIVTMVQVESKSEAMDLQAISPRYRSNGSHLLVRGTCVRRSVTAFLSLSIMNGFRFVLAVFTVQCGAITRQQRVITANQRGRRPFGLATVAVIGLWQRVCQAIGPAFRGGRRYTRDV